MSYKRLSGPQRPTPREGLSYVNASLSDAQDAIGRFVLNAPKDSETYKLGNQLFEEIEAMRHRVVARMHGKRRFA